MARISTLPLKRTSAWLIIILGLVTACATAAAETRLGILCTDSAGDAVRDILTAELSGLPDVTVLERGEWSKIAGERSLTMAGSAEVAKAAHLLGAEAIVVLEPCKLTSGLGISMRVISAKHGAALGCWEDLVSKDRFLEWSKLASDRLRRLMPKLALKGSNQSALSFVGFASPSVTPESARLEREVNSLFLKRLGAAPDILVLERKKLLETAFEKSLNNDDRRFWNGAYLVEGEINREGSSGDSVTIHFRLARPGGAGGSEQVLTSTRTNLQQLSSRFVEVVRSTLKTSAEPEVWDPAAEINRFQVEADGAVRWGFWPEAKAAADSVIALGRNDTEIRCTRLMAYTGFIEYSYKETVYGHYRPIFGVLQSYTFPPSPEQLDSALDIAYQLQDLAKSPTTILDDKRLRTATTKAISAVGALTMKYYFGAELRPGNEEKLAMLRAAMREVVCTLFSVAEERFRAKTVFVYEEREQFVAFFKLLAKYGPLWEETPEGGLDLHKRMYSIERPISLNNTSFQNETESEWTPRLCGWKWADRRRATDLWRDFIEKPPRLETPLNSRRVAELSLQLMPAPKRLELLTNSIQKHEVPSADAFRGLWILPKDQAKLALESLKQLRDWPDSPAKKAVQQQLEMEIRALTNRLTRPTNAPPAMVEKPAEPDVKPATSIIARNFLLPGNSPSMHKVICDERQIYILHSSWHSQTWSTSASGGQRFFREEYLTQISTDSGRAETINIPETFLSSQESREAIEMAIFPHKFLFFMATQVLIYDRTTRTFDTVSSPLASARVLKTGNRLLLCGADSIVETTDSLKQTRVIASVRRHPALNPVDELETLAEATLLPAGASNAMLVLPKFAFLLEGDRWRQPLLSSSKQSFKSSLEAHLPVRLFGQECLIQQAIITDVHTNFQTGHYYGPTAPGGCVWWSGIESPAGAQRMIHHIEPNLSVVQAYSGLPKDSPFFFYQGRGTDGSAHACFPFNASLFSLNLPSNPKADATLKLWTTNAATPLALSVSLPDRKMTFLNRLAVSSEAIVIWAENGIWWISRKELSPHIEALKSRPRNVAEARMTDTRPRRKSPSQQPSVSTTVQ